MGVLVKMVLRSCVPLLVVMALAVAGDAPVFAHGTAPPEPAPRSGGSSAKPAPADVSVQTHSFNLFARAQEFGVITDASNQQCCVNQFQDTVTATQGDARGTGSQTSALTFEGQDLQEVTSVGSAQARVGGEARAADGFSGLSMFFAVDEPTPFTLDFGLRAAGPGNPAGFECGAAVVVLDQEEISASTCEGSRQQDGQRTGTLEPGNHQFSVSATANVHRDTGDDRALTRSASFDITLSFEAECPVAPAATRRVGAAADQCISPGHIVFRSPGAIGNRILVEGADPEASSTPLNGPLLLRGASDDLNDPAWSPNGEHIAVTDDGEIAVMTAGGSDLRRLTNTPGDNFAPAWSPNGTKIAFTSTRDGGNSEIYVMNADGTNPRRLTNNPAVDSTPAWNPAGTRIAFVSDRRGHFDIFAMNADGSGSALRLTNDPAADVRPDYVSNSTIVFATNRDGNGEIYTMGAQGQDPANLTEDPAADSQPVVAPDGLSVAFLSNRDGNIEIYTMQATGGAATRLTTSPENESEHNWGISACTFYGSNGNDTVTRAGHLCGGTGEDTLTGRAGTEVLDGGDDDDRLFGKGGADVLIGGDEDPSGPSATNDRLDGGEGPDVISGNDGNDTMNGGGGADVLKGGDGNEDIEGDLGSANPGSDLILAGGGGDTIDGGPDGDSIHGEEGTDTIDGGDGPDRIRGGPQGDVFTACDGERDVLIGGTEAQPGLPGTDRATFDRNVDVLTHIEIKTRC